MCRFIKHLQNLVVWTISYLTFGLEAQNGCPTLKFENYSSSTQSSAPSQYTYASSDEVTG